MRVALIHYWIHTWRGGEKVLQAMAKLFPQADIFTHTYDRQLAARELPGRRIFTTFIDRLPLSHRYFERYLPLMPLALEQLDLRDYDLVISNESAPAKGVIVRTARAPPLLLPLAHALYLGHVPGLPGGGWSLHTDDDAADHALPEDVGSAHGAPGR